MATPLATLGQFRIGTTEYAAGRARTIGQWHMVRKQYGDNSSAYNYAVFFSKADYLAARQAPDSADWHDEPFSAIDYSLLLLPMATPLPDSTASAGAQLAAPGSSDSASVVHAIDASNNLLSQMLNGQQTPGSRATETTLQAVYSQLMARLHVNIDGGQVSLVNTQLWPDVQQVAGQFWQTTQPVSLAAVPLAPTAATSTAQLAQTSLLTDISAKLGGTLAVTYPATQQVAGTVNIGNWPASQPVTGNFYPATQPVSLATNTPDVTDRPARLLGHVTVDNQPASLAISNLPAVQAVSGPATDAQLRATPLPVSFSFPATQPVSLASTPGLTDTQLRATPVPVSGFPAIQAVSATSLPLPAGASTYAAQQLMQAALDAIKASTAAGPTATQQAAANAYLQTLATAGFSATVVSGPVTPYSLVAATGNNATLVKSGNTQLTSLTVTNATASYKYLMLYNLAAAPTTGAVPLVTMGVPPNVSIALPIPSGKYIGLSTGLAFAVGSQASLGTLVAGLLGTTGVAASDMVVNLTYA